MHVALSTPTALSVTPGPVEQSVKIRLKELPTLPLRQKAMAAFRTKRELRLRLFQLFILTPINSCRSSRLKSTNILPNPAPVPTKKG
jgi:hypothetical protein